VLQRDLRRIGERPRRGWVGARIALFLLVGIAAVGVAVVAFRASQAPTPIADGSITPAPNSGKPENAEWIRIPLRIPPPRSPAAPAQTAKEPKESEGEWWEHTIRPGDTLSSLFARAGLKPAVLHRVTSSSIETSALSRLKPGQHLQLRLTADGGIAELRHTIDPRRELRVTRNGSGFDSRLIEHELERRLQHASGVIHESLFLAAQDAGLPGSLTMALAEIFGWDIDFALSIRDGDQFTVLFEELYDQGERIGYGNILAAEFVNRGRTFTALRFEAPDGNAEYYAPDGQSMRKSFLRTPVKFSRISSKFDLRRRHPVLNRIRAHRGVDYAAPTGTPVRATGDGSVSFRGTKGGYGRTIVIRHPNGYSTLYAHLSRYAPKAKRGSRVQQGQVIAYVGKSGLATGPHLHYEFRVHGRHRNPLKVKLPKARPIPTRYRDAFEDQASPLLSKLERVKTVLLTAR